MLENLDLRKLGLLQDLEVLELLDILRHFVLVLRDLFYAGIQQICNDFLLILRDLDLFSRPLVFLEVLGLLLALLNHPNNSKLLFTN